MHYAMLILEKGGSVLLVTEQYSSEPGISQRISLIFAMHFQRILFYILLCYRLLLK